MLERLSDRDLGQTVERRAQERPAGSGQDDFIDVGASIALQALKDRAVLAIDGQEPHALFFGRFDEDFAGHDQGFFVGQSDFFAGEQTP